MLRLENVVSGYGKVKILRGVSLHVPKGQIVTLLGGNGTGKSTLLKLVSGLIAPWSGEVLFEGEPIGGHKPYDIVRRGLVQVTQGKEVFPNMTVEENLKLGAYVLKGRHLEKAALDEAYGHFPILADKRRQYAGTLSGGQLQMLCIGRGLMSRPKMLLLDEPSAALAPQIILDIFKAIRGMNAAGLTILIVEQNVRMALLLSSYGYVIKDGVIHMSGNARDMIKDDNVRLSFLGGTVAARSVQLPTQIHTER